SLLGRRLEKIYETEPGLFRFDFAFGDSFVVKLGEYFYLTKSPPQAPQNPSSFAMYLRKYVEGRKLESIEGAGSDRIYCLKFREAPAILLEQFAGGNLFLLDGENRILRAYHSKPSEKRQYKSGEKYEYPASASFSLPPGMKEWEAAARDKPSASLSSLLGRWPIGKTYTQDLLQKLGWGDKKAGEVNEKQARELMDRLAGLMRSPAPRVYEDKEGRGVELSLVPLERFGMGGEARTFPSFSQAVEYFSKTAQAPAAEAENPQLIKLRHRLKEQQTALARLDDEISKAGGETKWLEENLHQLEERRGKILEGRGVGEKVDEKKINWRVSP
ncbi:MAG: NFACT family protein, partial [Candidatus Marsarchaeota archaeon]|nr:NFACT family protein [Candidatus Marsarchaeota archaeon]